MDNDVLRNPQTRFAEQKDNPMVKGLLDFIQGMHHTPEEVSFWQIYDKKPEGENDFFSSRPFSVNFKDNTGFLGTLVRKWHNDTVTTNHSEDEWWVDTYRYTFMTFGESSMVTIQAYYGQGKDNE